MDFNTTRAFLVALIESKLDEHGVNVYSDRGQSTVEIAVGIAGGVTVAVLLFLWIRSYVTSTTGDVPQHPINNAPAAP